MMRKTNIHKKGTFKERFPYFWMELLIVAILVVFFVIVWQTEREEQREIFLNDIGQIEEGISYIKSIEDVTPETITAELYERYAFRENSGLAIEFYDIDGNPIAQNGEENIWIYWNPDASQQSNIIFLDHLFTGEQLQPLLETDALDYVNQQMGYMEGYYDETNTFVITEIMYWYHDQENGEIESKHLRKAVPQDVTYEDLVSRESSNLADESGHGVLNIVTIDTDMMKKAYEHLDTVEKHWVGVLNAVDTSEPDGTSYSQGGWFDFCASVEVEGCFFRVAVVYAPVKMILASHTFWEKLIPFVVLCQGGALVFFLYQKSLRKKKREYDQMQHTFLNAMAHEMKTPAAVIKNGTECIKENIHPEKNEHYLDMISKEADHLNELLSKMLIFTRTNEGAYSLQKERLSLETLVNAVLPSYQLAMEFKGISIDVQTEDAKEICGDELLLKMVIDNFISNGIRYGNENSQMVVRIANRGLSVYNEGEVLSVEDQKRIWEPLYVVDAARSKNDGSAGMGLAICKNVLELHHARYGVENVVGGVRFFFELPE